MLFLTVTAKGSVRKSDENDTDDGRIQVSEQVGSLRKTDSLLLLKIPLNNLSDYFFKSLTPLEVQ